MLRCIEKLYQLPVTVQLLQDTGVGRTVNALRKGEGEIALAARTVIGKWKQMVADEEEALENQHAGTTISLYSFYGTSKYTSFNLIFFLYLQNALKIDTVLLRLLQPRSIVRHMTMNVFQKPRIETILRNMKKIKSLILV